MTVVQPRLQFGVAELNGDGTVRGFVEKPRSEHWVNGGFFCLEPGSARADRARQRARARAARAPGGRRASCGRSATRVLGLHGHLQGRGRAQRHVGAGPRAVEAVELSGRTRVCVTGAYGLLGAWLVRGAARPRRARGGVRRDEPARLVARAARAGRARSTVVTGDICDDGAGRAGARRVRGRQRLPPRRSDAGRDRQPRAAVDVRDQHPRHLDGARGVPAARRQRVVVASSDKAYGPQTDLPYREDHALAPLYPYDVSKAAADLIARSYWHTFGLPGGGDAVRQPVRRRGHQPARV